MVNMRVDRSFHDKNGIVTATQTFVLGLRGIERSCSRLIKEYGTKGE